MNPQFQLKRFTKPFYFSKSGGNSSYLPEKGQKKLFRDQILTSKMLNIDNRTESNKNNMCICSTVL